jgi:hypothetical protein
MLTVSERDWTRAAGFSPGLYARGSRRAFLEKLWRTDGVHGSSFSFRGRLCIVLCAVKAHTHNRTYQQQYALFHIHECIIVPKRGPSSFLSQMLPQSDSFPSHSPHSPVVCPGWSSSVLAFESSLSDFVGWAVVPGWTLSRQGGG